jgi:hypothetical protein
MRRSTALREKTNLPEMFTFSTIPLDKVRQHTNQQRKRIFDVAVTSSDVRREWSIGLDDRLRDRKKNRLPPGFDRGFKQLQRRAGIADRFTADDF